MIRIKKQNVLYDAGNVFKMSFRCLLDIIAKRYIQKRNQKSMMERRLKQRAKIEHRAKIVNNFQLLTIFGKMLHHRCLGRFQIGSGQYIFEVYFIWGTKKVVACCIRQVVVLYSNDYMVTGLGRLSIGHLRRVVILQRWSCKQV